MTQGQFKQRGDFSVKELESLVDFAGYREVMDIIPVGWAGATRVYVVSYMAGDIPSLIMVKDDNELWDFTTEEALTAYDNLWEHVRKAIGAYSNKYNKFHGQD